MPLDQYRGSLWGPFIKDPGPANFGANKGAFVPVTEADANPIAESLVPVPVSPFTDTYADPAKAKVASAAKIAAE